MADDWTFGADEPPPPRQPMTLVITDKRTGDRPALELTAVLQLDAGTLLSALAIRGDGDLPKLRRALVVLSAALVDDDGVPSTWRPEPTGDGPVQWTGPDGTAHDALTDALPPLAESSSRRKFLAAVEDDDRWQVSLDALHGMTTRIMEAASGGRPTGTPTPSPSGPGRRAHGSQAASGSTPRPSPGAGS